MIANKQIPLGKTDLLITPLGLGTMQWGDIKVSDRQIGVVDKGYRETFQVSLDMGINFFDTAEIYGLGRSEAYLGKYRKEISNPIIIATKFMPFPWRLSKGELRSALKQSLSRLGLEYVDLYQVHWPFPPIQIKAWMDAMADVVSDGLVKAVGVSNYSPLQTETAFEALQKRSIPLASNQIKYSLLHRRPEKTGLLDLCKKLEITVIAYSPLEKGILSGKYTKNNIPLDLRSWRYNRTYLKKIEPLLNAITEIGKKHGGKTAGQVSLNWLLSKGVVPIPGAKNMAQARENAGAMGWELSSEEVDILDNINKAVLQ